MALRGQERNRGGMAYGVIRAAMPAAPDHGMPRAKAQPMLKLDIEYVQPLFEGARNFALGVVEIGLHLHAVASRELPRPARQQVPARDPDIAGGRRIDRAAVCVALQRECAGRRSPIRPKARLAAVPAVVGRSAVGPQGTVAVGDLAVDPKRAVLAQVSALPRRGAALQVPGSRREQSALRFRGAPGDHVDHAVDRVGAPQRRARAADHLDPVDVFEQRVLRVPKDAREQRRVDSAPVDKDEELVCDRTGLIEAARADRILAGVDSGHLEIWRESERLGDTSGSRAANILAGDDKDGSGRVRQALGATRYRGDLEIGELLQAEVGQVGGLAGLRVRRESGHCGNSGYADARCVNAFFFLIDLNYPSQVSETETG